MKYDASEIDRIAKKIVVLIKDLQIIAFAGSLGAGKTTLIRSILKTMGVMAAVTSPTYTYMNIYTLMNGQTVYHFDLYRLDSLATFEQAGFCDYMYQKNAICFIEWPEIIMSMLHQSVGFIQIEFDGPDKRMISYNQK